MQQDVFLYNTLTRQKEQFVPRTPGEVSIYVCGVTPYDDAHLGHARPSVVFDVVSRVFRKLGYQVRLVQNFTDVDDKIIDRANKTGVSPVDLARSFSDRYLDSMDLLGVERAELYPRVSEHIEEIIAMIAQLVENGSAYESEGSVLFRVEAFPEYGKLSRQRKEELLAGVRVDTQDGKETSLDFALWKAAKQGEPAWESPWGPGRPGWHIECSAMSIKHLGNGFDIHGGGLDLVFPHHENEIAQSEACTGEAPFVRYWMHNGLINFGNEKMSKSLGNFVTVDELVQRYGAALIRYAILQQHYRSPMEFSDEQMERVGKGWDRLNKAVFDLRRLGKPLSLGDARAAGADERLAARAEEARTRALSALCDDFNTPAALAALFELIRDARGTSSLAAQEGVAAEVRVGLQAVLGVLEEFAADVLGIVGEEGPRTSHNGASDELVGALVEMLLEVRDEARKARDFQRADRLRDRLGELGITIEDSPEGAKWARKT